MRKKYDFFIKIIFSLAIAYALISGSLQTSSSIKKSHNHPQRFLGQKFYGLSTMLSGQRRVGYLSQNSIDTDKQAAAEFAQAQFVLTPLIIEHGRTDLDFLIYNTNNPGKAVQELKKIGYSPVKINHFGIILAQLSKTQTP